MPGRIIFWAAPLLVPALFFLIWEFMATLVGNSLILPPLEEIGALLAHPLDNVIAMGTLAGNIGISLVRVLCGYAAAVLLNRVSPQNRVSPHSSVTLPSEWPGV